MKRISRKLLLGIILLLLAISSATAFVLVRHAHDQNKANPNGTSKTAAGVTYKPATKEEQQESNDNKDTIVKDKDGNTAPSGQASSVTPLISYSQQSGSNVEVDAYISGVAEDGGTCTLQLSKQGQATISRTSPAFMNASTSNCQNFSLNRSDFPVAGAWSVVVQYKSKTAEGTSATGSLQIQ